MDKFSLYDQLSVALKKEGFEVGDYRTIQYGLQFPLYCLGQPHYVRLFDGKKGLKVDLSQLKNEALEERVTVVLSEIETRLVNQQKKTRSRPAVESCSPDTDPDTLIGIDESGKGDYFGPLVVAAVYVNPEKAAQLKDWGVTDSKLLMDKAMCSLSTKIKSLCPHSIISLASQNYNEVYDEIGNLNHVLAWGHARVLEGVLKQVPCQYALSDQFAKPSLVRDALLAKGKGITLYQRPKAESNIAVAAASVLARAHFVEAIENLSEKLECRVPKGCSDQVIQVAKELVAAHGSEILRYVAKVHFKITKQVVDDIKGD